ncbi:glycosyltransferase [Paenibacillus piscarius]|uniref:glycosyltransferase n=1 Tax=Paenibacillus piscarius TaxID=1089681 RepID=UPI001EE8EFD8|nr:glycosyltransferase [Paenibacillus piscarius]
MKEKMLFLSARRHATEQDKEEDHRTKNILGILQERFDIDLLEDCCSSRSGSIKPLRTALSERCRLQTYSHVFIPYNMPGTTLDLVASLLPGAFIITDARRAAGSETGRQTDGVNGFSRGYHKLNAALRRREEQRVLSRTGLLLTATEWDALSYKALSFADANKVHVIPPCIDLNKPPYNEHDKVSRENSVILRWNTNTVQGREQALVFIESIYPLVKAAVADSSCYIISISGNVHPEVAAAVQRDSSLKIIGEAEEAAGYMRRARAVVASLEEGCGDPANILEAWAHRTPVVSSLTGAEALFCEPGRNILLAETTDAYAEHLVRLLTMPELGSIIADQAYRTLRKHYTADSVRKKLLNLISDMKIVK